MKKIFSLAFLVFLGAALFSQAKFQINPKIGDARSTFVENAKKYLDAPYLKDGNDANGIDDAGLVCAAIFDSFGRRFSRNVNEQYSSTEAITDLERQPGDLLFFQSNNSISHVAVYLGNNQIIHCVEGDGVKISDLSDETLAQSYVAARRFLPSSESLSEMNEQSNKIVEETQSAKKSKKKIDEKPTKKDEKKKSKNRSAIELDVGGAMNWTVVKSMKTQFAPIGANINVDLLLNSWLIKPGIGFQTRFMKNYGDGLFMPLYFSLTFPLNFRIYAGWVLESKPARIDGHLCKLSGFFSDDSKFSLVGLTWATPAIGPKSFKISLVQDFSYIKMETDRDFIPILKFFSAFSFSTGIRLCFFF